MVTEDWFDLPCGASATRPIWAIGDIHGCTDHLAMLYDFLHERAAASDLLIHLGDYVDRGRDSPGALTMVARGPGVEGLEVIALRGNHDQYLINGAGLEGEVDPGLMDRWVHNGGETTLDDLRIRLSPNPETLASRLRDALGPERIAFLRATRLMHRESGITFVHAGLDPARSVDDQLPHDLMWIRERFFECPQADWPFECLVVHGHSPRAFGLDYHRIGVDSGSFVSGEVTMLEIHGAKGRFHRALI